jgi:hypothetical protein
MLYDAAALEPISYYVLGLPMPPAERFPLSRRRAGFRGIKMQQANHQRLRLADLAALLFPGVTGS